MDRKLGNNLYVGLLVLGGFAAFLFVLFNIGGGFFNSSYPLYARFKHVKGLHFGSEVSLAGLRIGTVKNISVAEDDPKQLVVLLNIDGEHRARVRTDSVATIRTQGMLGDKYIEVSLGTPDYPEVKPKSTLISQEDEDFFAKGGGLVSEVKRYFDKGGEFEALVQSLNALSKNLVVLTHDVKQQKGLLHEAIYGESGKDLALASKELRLILTKIEKGEGTIGGLINDPTVYEDMKALMGGAKRSSVLRYFLRSFVEEGNANRADGKSVPAAPKR